jgi:hypothetical protein
MAVEKTRTMNFGDVLKRTHDPKLFPVASFGGWVTPDGGLLSQERKPLIRMTLGEDIKVGDVDVTEVDI